MSKMWHFYILCARAVRGPYSKIRMAGFYLLGLSDGGDI